MRVTPQTVSSVTDRIEALISNASPEEVLLLTKALEASSKVVASENAILEMVSYGTPTFRAGQDALVEPKYVSLYSGLELNYITVIPYS
jgi:hypothetical protein